MESLKYVLSFPKQNKCKCDRNGKHGDFPLCQCILHPPVLVAKWVSKATSPRHLRVRVQLQVLEQALLWCWASQILTIELWVWRWGLGTGWTPPPPEDLWQLLETFLVVIVGTDRSSLASSVSKHNTQDIWRIYDPEYQQYWRRESLP